MTTQGHRNGIRASLFWVLLIIGLIAVVGRQRQINALLARENQHLQEQLGAFEDTRNENTELQSERERLRRFQDAEAQQIQVLRAEIQMLRQGTNELRRILGRRLTDTQIRLLAQVQEREDAARIRATQHGGWLGLNDIRDVRALDSNPYAHIGIFIGAIVPGSPAEKAKMQAGDLVFGMDGQAITGMDDLQRAQIAAGQPVALDVARRDLEQEIVMRINVIPSDWPTRPPPSRFE